MPQTIADTVKALTEFEAELDRVKAEAMEAKRKLVLDSADWAETAKNSSLAEAHETATQRLAQARTEAEAEADEIRKKGQAETKKFAESISKQKKAASELVIRRLLGEGQ